MKRKKGYIYFLRERRRFGRCPKCLIFCLKNKHESDCTLARNENVAEATALGAGISQAKFYFDTGTMGKRKVE